VLRQASHNHFMADAASRTELHFRAATGGEVTSHELEARQTRNFRGRTGGIQLLCAGRFQPG
jgi:hypothetical protein